MVVMTQKKGKEGTKGGKQIAEENVTTLVFYRNMFLGSILTYVVLMLIFRGGFEGWDMYVSNGGFHDMHHFFSIFAGLINGSSFYFMKFMGRATYSEAGGLIDCGVDLNMAAGVAEHVKDIIILTSGCQVLSFLSRYFWLLWLLVPLKACYYVWANILAPWFFAPAPEAAPGDEKKQRKMERRMRR